MGSIQRRGSRAGWQFGIESVGDVVFTLAGGPACFGLRSQVLYASGGTVFSNAVDRSALPRASHRNERRNPAILRRFTRRLFPSLASTPFRSWCFALVRASIAS